MKSFFLLLAALMFMPMVANAFTGTAVIDDINYYINTEDKTAEVRANYALYEPYDNSYSGDVVIPETVEYDGVTCNVTSIGERAFSGCSGLTSVTIPNSVTNIGISAFRSCSKMTSVTIPNSVTSIGGSAFSGCSGLTSVTIPNSVTSIGWSAFEDCSSLTSVTIGNSVTSIGSSAFWGCSSLTSVTIGNSVTSIGESAFYKCSGLTSVQISDLEAWCNISFSNYYASPLYYAHYLYLNGEEVKDLVIPNSVTSIGNSAFSGCSGPTSVTIPNSVTSIGDYAFCECSDLTSVTIPNSVTSIGVCAFAWCPKLEDVFCFAETVPTIDPYAFYEEGSASYDYIRSATLHVPEGSVSDYENTAPWSKFGTIVGFTLEKCATPTITYANGKVRCTCETEGVTYVYTITPASYTGQSTDGLISLGTSFTVNVKATRDGYTDSDTATTTVNISQVGDMDGDGELTVTDVTSLVNAILGK